MNAKDQIRHRIAQILKETMLQEVVLDISKNTEVAPNMGSQFGQDVEPKGTYVTQGKNDMDGWVNGKAQLKNPLYIKVNDSNVIKYKYELSQKYKAKGNALTKKLMKQGHDAIITVQPDGQYGEIILFPNASFMLN